MAQPRYRNFDNPPAWVYDGSRDPNNTDTWIAWMVDDENLIHDFLPRPDGTCRFCGSPVRLDDSGRYYPYCFNCNKIRHHLDVLIPGSYSLDSGLESLVKTYKDFGRMWTAGPTATMLWEMFDRHGECIRDFAGQGAIYTWVPADNPRRTFDHIEKLITSVKAEDLFGWQAGVVERNRDRPRPGPRKDQTLIDPEAYRVMSEVRGRTLVLLDDLWTSGSSMASTAAALKGAGAARVIGLVLGRQLQRGSTYGEAQRVFAEVEARGWAFDECVLCARP